MRNRAFLPVHRPLGGKDTRRQWWKELQIVSVVDLPLLLRVIRRWWLLAVASSAREELALFLVLHLISTTSKWFLPEVISNRLTFSVILAVVGK
jgi:hypothetical protein